MTTASPPRPLSWLRWPRRLVVTAAVLVALYALAGYFLAPPLVRHQLASVLSSALEREVTIDSVEMKPFTLEASLHGLRIKERGDARHALEIDELAVDLEAVSLVHRALVVRELRIVRPTVRVTRFDDGRYSFGDILDRLNAQPATTGEPARFSVNNIAVTGGRIEFDDRPERLRHVLADLELGIPFVSSLPVFVDINVEPRFAAKLNDDPIEITGTTKPFKDSLETALHLNARDLDLARYLEYLPFELDVKLADGQLALALDLAFTRYKDKPAHLKLSGSAALTGATLVEKNGARIAKVEALDVRLERYETDTNALVLESISVRQPALRIHRNAAGDLNLAKLVPPRGAGASAQGPALALAIKSIRLESGEIDFSDDAAARPFRVHIDKIDGSLDDFSLEPGRSARFALAASTGHGATAKAAGELALEPLAATGRIELAGIRAKDYAPYFERAILFDIEDGVADAAAHIDYRNGGVALSRLEANARSVALRKRADRSELVRVGQIRLADTAIDIERRTVAIGEIASRDARVLVRRDRDGLINLASLVAAAEAPEAPAAPSMPWTVTVRKASVENHALRVENETSEPPVSLVIDPIAATLTNFASTPGSRAELSINAGVNRSGSLAARGPISIDPPAAELELDAKAIDIVPFQPYFAQFVNLVVAAGRLGARGRASIAVPRSGAPTARFAGDVSLAEFASADKTSGEPLLRWKSLFLGELAYSSAPDAITVKEISLADFFARVILSREGRLNLQDVLVASEAAAAKDAKDAKPAITLGRITLQGGNVEFTDHFIRPNYSANLTGLGGAVGSLSAEQAGDVDLRGAVDRTAPLEIIGKINPLAKDLFLDLKANARDIELSPMTPYSAKYVGYGIERGKLSMKLAYRLEDRKLEADNNLYLDQLTFGERVESPEATKLPVLLAVALLKDRNGVIDINLPVSGSLDDPQFSVGGLILRVIGNLLLRAVTSPFALLSAAFGGEHGEALGNVEFDPGRAELTAASVERLKTLAKALADRPGLKLDIAGSVDRETDREGLRQALLERAIRTQKFNELARKGAPAASLEAVTIDAAERARFLEAVYRQAAFPKPKNALGFNQSLPPAEMEKLIVTHTTIGEDDLRELANERAQAAKEWLVGTGEIPVERVFIVAPKLDTERPKDGKASRASFELR